MERTASITYLMEISGLAQSAASALVDQQGSGNIDLHEALRNAAAAGTLRPKDSAVATMVLLTGLSSDRASTLLAFCKVPHDLNSAIIEAFNSTEIDRQTAAVARMRALTNLPQSRVRYLLQQSPQFNLESAVAKAQVTGEISAQNGELALLKILTGFSDEIAAKLLDRENEAKNRVLEAIVQGAGQFEDPASYTLARLRAALRISENGARQLLLRQDVNGDYEKGFRQHFVDLVQEKINVDTEDAFKYLNQTRGNVDEALILAQENHLAQPHWGGETADTRNPPNVHHNTHIVGVLGVSDQGQRRASPRSDGWMVSDFYLWINVLRGMGKSQAWFSCENPHALVYNYGTEDRYMDTPDEWGSLNQVSWKEGYLHGDPFEDRVVVLSRENVKEVAIRVTLTQRGTNLRDEFLRHVETICKLASSTNEPVLLMAFCHGDYDEEEESGGLTIGIDPGSQNADDYLSTKLLAQILAKTPSVKVSLYLTSCYSGNWVITPSFGLIRPTVMAGAQADEETHAWTASNSQRHAGGVYTSAFLKELLKQPAELPEDADADEARTYDEVCKAIVVEANRLCVQGSTSFGSIGSTPMFTPEGGHDKFRRRTGYALANYKENFDRLVRVPASDTDPVRDNKRLVDEIPDVEIKDWQARHPEGSPGFQDRTGGYGETRRGMKSSLTYLAAKYMRSKPGPREEPANTSLHSQIELFFSGTFDTDDGKIEEIRSMVLYRTWMMRSANSYREWLNLNKVPVIEAWDQGKPGKAINLAKQNLPLVRGSGLFQRPDAAKGHWGQTWQKPFFYLAYAFAASSYGPKDIPRLLLRLKENQRSSTLRRTIRFMTLPNSKKSVRELSEVLKRTWGKSVVKRKRGSLEDAGLRPSSTVFRI